jgi:single-strand DNA-binding protein
MPDGKPVTNFSIATSKTFKDKNGDKQERTEWHRIVLFGRNAEIAQEYLKKGSMSHISGELRTRKWTDKEGVERYATEIVGQRLTLIGGATRSNVASPVPEAVPPDDQAPPPDDLDEMDF